MWDILQIPYAHACVVLTMKHLSIKTYVSHYYLNNTLHSIYENNMTCITQIKGCYIKGDRTNHISLNFSILTILKKMTTSQYNKFVQRITWQTFFTKSLPTATFEKLVHNIGMRWLTDLKWSQVLYLSAIGALMYLVNNSWPYIAFLVNLLARYSFSPTKNVLKWN